MALLSTKQVMARVGKAYDALDFLNDISTGKYRDECLHIAVVEERRHRRNDTDKFALTVCQTAKMDTVRRIAIYLSNKERMLSIGDILTYKASAVYAAALVDQHGAQIKTALEPHDIGWLADLDYVKLINRTPRS